MTLVILLAFLLLLAVFSLGGRHHVSWAGRMRRLNAGTIDQAEWMAPDDVILRVQADYLETMDWLVTSQSVAWAEQWAKSSTYFSGNFLRQHQNLLRRLNTSKPARYAAILRCAHNVTVRHFSEDGETCFVIDHQTECRMAMYHVASGERINTQDLGETHVVYQMVYDKQAKRWKLDRYVQQLPVGWSSRGKSHLMSLHVTPLLPRGRNN